MHSKWRARLTFLGAGLALLGVTSCASMATPPAAAATNPALLWNAEQAGKFARMALASVVREYPNKPMHVHVGPESALRPGQLHPSFFGSFDWHSAVHGHWLLVRLLKEFPQAAFAPEARAVLERHLAPEHVAVEAAYFQVSDNRGFERMYGWAWLLRLSAELATWTGDADAARWREQLRPLEDLLVVRVMDYLPRLTYAIRTGVHPDTAFALAQILDYARMVGNAELESMIVQRALAWFAEDRDWSFDFEPSGEDFFSPGLNEADLMRRVLPPAEFSVWLNRFWPGLRAGQLGPMAEPAFVSDLTDGRIVHLVGLNLTRAWTLRGIASALPVRDPRRARLLVVADRHAEAGLGYVFSGHYAGEHWLASFSVYLLTNVGIQEPILH